MPVAVVVRFDDEVEVARTVLQQITLHSPCMEQSLQIGDQRYDQRWFQGQRAIPGRQRLLSRWTQLRQQELRIFVRWRVQALR